MLSWLQRKERTDTGTSNIMIISVNVLTKCSFSFGWMAANCGRNTERHCESDYCRGAISCASE